MKEKKNEQEDQILAQYEIELRNALVPVVGLAVAYGFDVKETKKHIIKILEESISE